MVDDLARVRRLATRAVPVALIVIGCLMLAVALSLLADDAVAETSGAGSTRAAGVAHIDDAHGTLPSRHPVPSTTYIDVERLNYVGALDSENAALARAVEESSFGGGYAQGDTLTLAIGPTGS